MTVAPAVEVRVDPALAEAAVRAATAAGRVAGDAAIDHRARLDPVYELPRGAAREAAFARLALGEFARLDLAGPLLAAVEERPALAASVTMMLLGEPGRRSDDGVTCEPGGAHIGIRVAARRFDDPGALLAWARHVLGHAEDTLDPTFGFVAGWDAAPGAARSPAVARLHRLWDISVDARLAAAGRLPSGPTRRRHREQLHADLPGIGDAALDAVLDHTWGPTRPTFEQLADWAARPVLLLEAALPGASHSLRPDRCPLCRFAADDIVPPEPSVSSAVAMAYPDWRPEDGLCSRCADRFRLTDRLGGCR